MNYILCTNCNKPLSNEENVYKFRILLLGSTVIGGILGCATFPLLGFGSSGISAGSYAASWQASIGSVAAGSLFAILQSLGAKGLGILLFGSSTAAISLLTPVAANLNWCTCNQNVS
ncbi:PREDICTED: interferon alpha-inducible protein 27-like protein 1 [Wasmannia auropunctata]|uniref:interferon alpha-inducible protein 27-like protein 1 n=1 Tax=Wasmannia auropunctata TaxID=64793 RepID=UPI0005EECA41|nr:PREDICTED: interferon alpha-inducible protein 27-like protein 1 [Wasmannia auropunctata]